MLDITHGASLDGSVRTTEIDFHPPAGPVIRLTRAQWRELVRWIGLNGDTS